MMKRALLVGALLASTSLSALAADAAPRMTRMHQSGNWHTDLGINSGGFPQCMTGMEGHVGDASAQFTLNWDSYAPQLVILHFWKSTWTIPTGQYLRVRLQVDKARPMVYQAYGTGQYLEITVNWSDKDSVTGEPEVLVLTNLLKAGLRLNVEFPDYGAESGWSAPLEGSAIEIAQFAECVLNLDKAIANEAENGEKKAIPANPAARAIPSYKPL
jgi:hypothetical protein